MKHILRILPLLAFILTACQQEEITPSGNINRKEYNFYQDYFQVNVSDGIQYTITPSDSDKVVIETDDNVQAEISVKQVGNIIYIKRKDDSNVKWERTIVKANIQTAQTLYAIQGEKGSVGSCDFSLWGVGGNLKIMLSGKSSFQSSISMPNGNLWVELSDSSEALLSGTTKETRLLSESGSKLKAYDLTSTNLVLQIFSGGSTAYATVTEKIFAVDAKGASTLYYKGSAIVNENSSFSEGASAVFVN
jgi:hypothetical protein